MLHIHISMLTVPVAYVTYLHHLTRCMHANTQQKLLQKRTKNNIQEPLFRIFISEKLSKALRF